MPDWGSPVSGAKYPLARTSVLIPPSATVHTKGAWTPLITLERSGAITIGVDYGQAYTTFRTMLFDLAIGSTGNEKVILENLGAHYSAVGVNACREKIYEIQLPVALPEGSVLSARSQSSYASNAGGYLFATTYNVPGPWVGSVIDTYGAVASAATRGTIVTAATEAATWGVFKEITPSCQRMEAFFIAAIPTVTQNALSNQYGEWELCVGDAGSENRIASGFIEASLATASSSPQMFGPYYYPVAAGQRLSMRMMRVGTVQKTMSFIVYGVR